MQAGIDTLEWIRDDDGNGHWAARAGARAMLDLRPLPDQAMAGEYGERPFVFVLYEDDAKPSDAFHVLSDGDPRESRLSGKSLDAWESLFGYRPAGVTLSEWLFDHLTLGADPAGLERAKPILPGVDRWMRLIVAGAELASHKHHWGDKYTSHVADVLKDDFREQFALDPTHARKCLDWQREKYRLAGAEEWKQLVPSDLLKDVPGPLEHETSFTESWPTDSLDISTGQDQIWTEVLGDCDVDTGRIKGTSGNTEKRVRCETVLSGADHYCQGLITHITGVNASRAVAVDNRFDATDDTCYRYRIKGMSGGESIEKCITGTISVLTSGARTGSASNTMYIEANGSSLEAKYAGSTALTVTDTAITGGVRIGCGGNGQGSVWGLDDIAAADLAAPAAGQPTMRRWGGAPGMRLGGQPFGRSW